MNSVDEATESQSSSWHRKSGIWVTLKSLHNVISFIVLPFQSCFLSREGTYIANNTCYQTGGFFKHTGPDSAMVSIQVDDCAECQ